MLIYMLLNYADTLKFKTVITIKLTKKSEYQNIIKAVFDVVNIVSSIVLISYFVLNDALMAHM